MWTRVESGGMLTQNLSGRTERVTCTDEVEVEGGLGFFFI